MAAYARLDWEVQSGEQRPEPEIETAAPKSVRPKAAGMP